MTEPTTFAPARIADLLSASAATAVAELLALGDDAGWQPEPGEWSANECVGHMMEAERRGFAGRIRLILEAPQDRPAQLEAWDPPAVAEARRDHLRSASELAASISTARNHAFEGRSPPSVNAYFFSVLKSSSVGWMHILMRTSSMLSRSQALA